MKTILLPTDGSDLSQRAVKEGMMYAKALGARVIGLHVVPEFHTRMDEGFAVPSTPVLKQRYEEESKARARQVLLPVEQEANGAGIECDCIVGINDSIHLEIINVAEKNRCDLIVMASHGHAGVTALLLGSETAKVLTHTKLPVLVMR